MLQLEEEKRRYFLQLDVTIMMPSSTAVETSEALDQSFANPLPNPEVPPTKQLLGGTIRGKRHWECGLQREGGIGENTYPLVVRAEAEIKT